MTACALRVSDAELNRWNGVLGRNSARAENGTNRHTALARDLANDFADYKSNTLRSSSHSVAPLSRRNNRSERGTMSSGKERKTLGELVASALGRRIGYGITRKQLQHALNVSSGTVDNLLSGNNDPSPRVFMALLQFFDAAFANEILAQSGLTVVKLAEVRAAEKILEGLAELQSAQGRVK